MAAARPKFNPSRCSAATDVDTLRLNGNEGVTWTPLITCPADFPIELVCSFDRYISCCPAHQPNPLQFEHAVSQLIHHPEYNSTLILRSEVIQDSIAGFPDLVPALQDLQPIRNIHRKLLPRRPTRDPAIEQHCTLYAPLNSHLTDAESLHPTVLVLTPLLPPDGVLPYYHPTVTHLAFRFIPPTTTSPSNEAAAAALRIEVIPLPGTSLDTGARLYRTCLALLETLHRYGWGTLTQYKKRVLHDVLVPRETYQDLYLVMRERHKHLVNEWREVTDPLKHVFEVRSAALFPAPLDPKALIIHHRTHHHCYAGHRHRDVPHASLERHLRSRDHPS
jgi:tRNASer (uridine44-2'-O)-methyltransferase